MNLRPGIFLAIHEWDVFTFNRIVTARRTSGLIGFARSVSHSGNGYIYPLVPLALLLLDLPEPLSFLKLALFAFTVERILYLLAKNSFRRKRPANILPSYSSVITASDEFSFPSGHSSAAFLMVTLLVMTYGSAFVIFYLWAALVAISRVLLGVHFPSDILVGSLLGMSIATIAASVF